MKVISVLAVNLIMICLSGNVIHYHLHMENFSKARKLELSKEINNKLKNRQLASTTWCETSCKLTESNLFKRAICLNNCKE